MLDRYSLHERQSERLFNQVEARLARHWPELEEWLSIRKHASARALLEQFPSPQRVAKEPDRAAELLRRASRSMLSPELINGVVESAGKSFGVPMVAQEEVLLSDLIRQLRVEIAACDEIEAQTHQVVKGNPAIDKMRAVVGIMAATAIVTYLGSPLDYPSARTLQKAAGLNMIEMSSGTHQGALHISKRGPGVVRRLLFLAALRAVANEPIARAWYCGRKSFHPDHRTPAVVALMRKLLAAAYAVAKQNVEFDVTKLFDVRRLTLAPAPVLAAKGTRPKARTQPRSIARHTRPVRSVSAGGANP